MVKKLDVPLPRWKHGVCQTMDSDIFFMDADDRADQPNEIAAIACAKCMISVACLKWAMDTGEKFGIWGGTTPRQRDKLRRPIIRVSCIGCASTLILEEPGQETCLSCGLSWKI